MQTQAAISRGPSEPFSIEEVSLAPLRDDEVLVRIVAAGLCHTDLAMKAMLPDGTAAVFGHEGAGVVEQIGPAVTGIEVGDHVVLSFANCGRCDRCRSGHPAYCRQFAEFNTTGSRVDGTSVVSRGDTPLWSSFFGQSSFAHYAVASQLNTVVVPRDLDLTLLAPFGCGFQTGASCVVNVLRATPGDSLVVYGAGGVGMAAIMAAKAIGLETIIAVDLSQERRSLALELGASHALDGAAQDIVAQINSITGGGADRALDTTAVPAVIRNATAALTTMGVLVVVGLGQQHVELDFLDLIASGKVVQGSIEGDADPQQFVHTMIDWMKAGKFPVEKVIQRYPFDEINEAVAATRGSVVKAVLTL